MTALAGKVALITGAAGGIGYAIAPMRALDGGRIINLGSIIGKNGGNARPWINPEEQNRSSNIAYGVSKAGVHALTFFLARELATSGITVNAIAPGPIC